MAEQKLCFVIAPIGEPESDTRKRSDQILKYVISAAVNQCGYHAIRADQISEPGIITSQVIQHVVDDPLVIADLTDRNPNVFYELALRHVIKKPLVQIIRKGEPLPFDVAGTRTIPIDHRDLESVENAKSEIIKQVKAIERSVLEIDSPISVALDLQLLKQSDNPEQRSLADMLSAISEIRTSIASIEKKISSSDYSRFRGLDWVSDYSLHTPPLLLKLPVEGETKYSSEQLDLLMSYLSRLRTQVASKEQDKKIQEQVNESEDQVK